MESHLHFELKETLPPGEHKWSICKVKQSEVRRGRVMQGKISWGEVLSSTVKYIAVRNCIVLVLYGK